jgi:hypothetical protein
MVMFPALLNCSTSPGLAVRKVVRLLRSGWLDSVAFRSCVELLSWAATKLARATRERCLNCIAIRNDDPSCRDGV